MKQTYLSLEIPDDALVRAIAEESQIRDRDLDGLEKRVALPLIDPGEAAALALTIGRAGRASSQRALESARRELSDRGCASEAAAIRVAIDLLALRPPKDLERGERGYRRARGGEELLIEDPLAAHWHLRGRWGPPLRPELDAPVILARASGEVDRFLSALKEGRVVLVSFRPGRFDPPAPPLRITLAGFARDPAFSSFVRWSELSSVGVVERRASRFAAYEARGQSVAALPAGASIPLGDLVELMTQLLERARS